MWYILNSLWKVKEMSHAFYVNQSFAHTSAYGSVLGPCNSLTATACPHCLMKTWRPCGVRCASVDEGETEGPTFISCVSPGFWGYLLLTQEWKPQIKVFVLTKDKRDFSFTQTVQDCVGFLKVSGKNVSWSAPLMKHVHEISACVPPLMFGLYTYKEVARIGGKEKWYFRKKRGMPPFSPVYTCVFSILEVGVNWIFMSECE